MKRKSNIINNFPEKKKKSPVISKDQTTLTFLVNNKLSQSSQSQLGKLNNTLIRGGNINNLTKNSRENLVPNSIMSNVNTETDNNNPKYPNDKMNNKENKTPPKIIIDDPNKIKTNQENSAINRKVNLSKPPEKKKIRLNEIVFPLFIKTHLGFSNNFSSTKIKNYFNNSNININNINSKPISFLKLKVEKNDKDCCLDVIMIENEIKEKVG